MNLFWQIIYNTLGLILLYSIMFVGFMLNEKIRKGIKGRKGLWLKLKKELTPGKWVWFHISSMGEFEQAKPIITTLREKRKDIKILVSFFSPSGYEPAIEHYKDADVISYLPFDTLSNAKKMLKLVNPVLLIFIKYDLWPNFVWQAKRMKIPMLLADGSLSQSKSTPFSRSFYKQVYSQINTICAISKEDESFFKGLVNAQTMVLVAGDTRYDQVYRRLLRVKKEGFESSGFFPKQARIIVAGSTWLNDEEVVLPSYKELRSEFKELVLVLVPHEPNPERLAQLEKMASKLNMKNVRWSEVEKTGTIAHAELIIVDKIGILANLYSLGDIAYVGGSFGYGVHNCLEPAVMGKAVFFGPKIDNSKEAKLLVERQAGFVITTSGEMTTKITQLLTHPESLSKANQAAFELVKENLGATEKIMGIIWG
ncbi:MAG: glycosyltransferase N-terminal domain-containing protein [bacterium]|nr:glycosyltransferase N-terminal domain-containing protein [bacterium]